MNWFGSSSVVNIAILVGLLVAIFFLPWWLFLVLLFAAAVIREDFYSVLLAGLVADVVYYSLATLPFNLALPFTLIAAIGLLLHEPLKIWLNWQ